MKLIYVSALILLTAQAHAYTVLEVTAAKLEVVGQTQLLKISGPTAETLYQQLTAREVTDVENVLSVSKVETGIACVNESGGNGREVSCTLMLTRSGVAQTLRTQPPQDGITLSLGSAVAEKIYNFLTVQEQVDDAENYTRSKTAPGISLQYHVRQGSYDAVILLDPHAGVLQ